jgi:diacylglycerol kinase (ATP)
MSPFKGQTGLKRILNAAGYSLDGLRAAFTGEAAFRQLVLLNVLLIPLRSGCRSAVSSGRC